MNRPQIGDRIHITASYLQNGDHTDYGEIIYLNGPVPELFGYQVRTDDGEVETLLPHEFEVIPTPDPLPFVWPSGVRSMFSHGDGIELTFAPRPGFAQNIEDYELVPVYERQVASGYLPRVCRGGPPHRDVGRVGAVQRRPGDTLVVWRYLGAGHAGCQ